MIEDDVGMAVGCGRRKRTARMRYKGKRERAKIYIYSIDYIVRALCIAVNGVCVAPTTNGWMPSRKSARSTDVNHQSGWQ